MHLIRGHTQWNVHEIVSVGWKFLNMKQSGGVVQYQDFLGRKEEKKAKRKERKERSGDLLQDTAKCLKHIQ